MVFNENGTKIRTSYFIAKMIAECEKSPTDGEFVKNFV